MAGAQSLLRVSDDSYKRGLDRFKKGDLNGAIEEFDQALDAYLSNRAAYGAGITPVARTKTSRASPWITATWSFTFHAQPPSTRTAAWRGSGSERLTRR